MQVLVLGIGNTL